MLGPVLSQIQQKVGIYKAQCSVMVSTLKLHCSNIIALGIDLATRIVQSIKSQYVQLKLNIEPYLAQFIIQARLMKVELMIVLLNLGVRGQQLLITVRQIPQRVYKALKREH